jgi:hypothetical protein
MINGLNDHTPVSPRVMTSTTRNDEVEQQKQNLKKQAEALRKVMTNGIDTAEISDEARALAANGDAPIIFNKNTAESTAPLDETEGLATREERDATAKNYDKILEDLRAEYGEEGAMRRFDKIMEDAGYERVAENKNGIGPNGGTLPGMAAAFTAGVTMPPSGQGLSSSNLQTYSSIRGAMGSNGEVEYLAETYANYASDLSGEARGVTGTSVVSESTDLGALAANLLKKAGVELGEGESMRFNLNENGELSVYGGGFDAAEYAALQDALAADPSIARAFKAEYDSVAQVDTSSLAGAYDDGVRSVSYQAHRSFTYSASNPSAVVMTDSVSARSTGYNYQKKVSDSFDINADGRMASNGGVNLLSGDFENAQKIGQELQAKLNEAAETGGLIGSTVTQGEYDSIQAARSSVENLKPGTREWNIALGMGLVESPRSLITAK